MKNPCYNCGKRTLGCHTFCQEYKSYRVEIDRRREKTYVENIVKDYETIKLIRINGNTAKQQAKDWRDKRK